MEKLVSVLMSVHNNKDTVIDSVQSILNQSYKNYEFLIMDDCSTDNTFELLNTFNDVRIRLFKNDKTLV